MSVSFRQSVRRVAVLGIAFALLQGTAAASVFSLTPTPFPEEAIYVPVDSNGDYEVGAPLLVYGVPITIPDGDNTLYFFLGEIGIVFPDLSSAVGLGQILSSPSATAPGVYDLTFVGDEVLTGLDLFSVPDSDQMFRLRSTPQSSGQMTVTSATGGGFHIDSFFDVFFEISLEMNDDGEFINFSPLNETPYHFELQSSAISEVPEPGTMLLVGAGLAACYRLRSSRRR